MFEFFRKEDTSEVADRASSHWTDYLKSPYVSIYNGNIRYKLESRPVLSEKQAIVFKKSLGIQITKALRKNGYLQISQEGPIIKKALMDAGAKMLEDRRGGNIMFIEDDNDLFFYSPGMNKATKF